MGDKLTELELVLGSTKENLTREEKNILWTCKAKAFRAFTFGACVASGVVWTATRRLSYEYRSHLSVGAGFLSGMWSCDRSLNSCLDHILALKGSRMQRVLTNLLLTRHQDNPRTLRLVNNHFYSEKVYDDSTLDQPKSRWRYRNFYGDNVGDNVGQQTHEDNHIHKPDLEPEQLTVSNVYFGQQTHEDNHIDKPDLEPEQLTVSNVYFGQQTHEDNHIHKPDLEPEQLTVSNVYFGQQTHEDNHIHKPDLEPEQLTVSNVYFGQQTHEDNHIHKPDLEPEQLTVSNVYFGQQTHEDNHIHKPDLEPEQLTRTSANDVIVDPLDCILGYAKPGDEIHHADSTGNSLRRKHARGHKKAHRRHRTHHSENP